MNLNDGLRARDELERAIASGRAEAIARSAMSGVWPLFCEHFALLTRAIESLPSSQLERYPVLRALHPMTPVLARTTRPFKPLIYPEDARAMPPDELDILTLAQMVSFRFSGDVSAALIYARRLEDRILQVSVESRERTDGPLWYFHQQIGSTLLAAGDSARALLEFATARQLGRLSPQPDAERLALGRTALAHAVRGTLDDADLALAELAGQPPATAAHVRSTAATERTTAALIAVERLSPDLDRRIAELEPSDSIELTWPFALLARTRAMLALHRPDDALEAIRLAMESHPSQYGAFANDVAAAMSIEAHCAVDDLQLARRIADANPTAGALTRLAVIRLELHASRIDVVARELRRVVADRSLSPGQRAETLLLGAWAEMAESGALDRTTAIQLSRMAQTPHHRRLFATMPRQLVEQVEASLTSFEREGFAGAVADMPHSELRTRPPLTRSELRVLRALPAHETTAAIAVAFHVSPNTVKSQLKSIYRKLGCSSRAEAIKLATRLNLLAIDADTPVALRRPWEA